MIVCVCLLGIECKSNNPHRRSVISALFERLQTAKNRFLSDLARIFTLRGSNQERVRRRYIRTQPSRYIIPEPTRHYVQIDEPVYMDHAHNSERNTEKGEERRGKSLNVRENQFFRNEYIHSRTYGTHRSHSHHGKIIQGPTNRKCLFQPFKYAQCCHNMYQGAGRPAYIARTPYVKYKVPYNRYDAPSDGYGVPLAPIQTVRPPYINSGYGQVQLGTARPPYVSDSYTPRPSFVVTRPPYVEDHHYNSPLYPPISTTSAPARTTTSQPPPCIELFTTTRFQIRSPRNSRYANPGQACQYIVVPGPDVCGLSITFSWFSLNTSQNCSMEYLDIEGNKLCGDLTGKTGQLSSN